MSRPVRAASHWAYARPPHTFSNTDCHRFFPLFILFSITCLPDVLRTSLITYFTARETEPLAPTTLNFAYEIDTCNTSAHKAVTHKLFKYFRHIPRASGEVYWKKNLGLKSRAPSLEFLSRVGKNKLLLDGK